MNELQQKNLTGTTKLIYILMLVGTLLPMTAVIALIMAYIYQDDAPDWMQTHYRFLIRTFWIGLLYLCIGAFTYLIVIGKLVMAFAVIWIIVRCIKGLNWLDRQQAVPNPDTWWFE